MSYLVNPYMVSASAEPTIMWKELGRTTLGGTSIEVNVTGLTDNPYLMILASYTGSDTVDAFLSFNGDESGIYANRYSRDGGSGSTDVSQGIGLRLDQGTTNPQFSVTYANNIATNEKLISGHTVTQNSAGGGSTPNRQVWVGKFADSSNVIDQVTLDRASGVFEAGSELVVLGFDPDGTDTTGSFWEELANVTYGSDQTVKPQIDTGVFDAKKYLWVQAWIKESTDPDTWFGYGASGTLADSSGSYAWRYNDNNTSDGAISNATTAGWGMGATTRHLNFFIVNNSGAEKLYVGNVLGISATGSASVPTSREYAGKGVDTSDPIRRIAIGQTTYTAYAGTTIKVWGSD